jgi:hypothetical protein
LDGDVVNNANGVFVEKSRLGLRPRRKFLITFGLENCTIISAIFPILGIDFCAEWSANRQLGIKRARHTDRLQT